MDKVLDMRSPHRRRLLTYVMRAGMAIGMFLHRVAPPRAPSPTFRLKIPARLTELRQRKGTIELVCYAPDGYPREGVKYPVVVNFHGGGFTIGAATDDVRWARAVVQSVDALVVCVDYRRGPEHPFPTAIEDGAAALLYLIDHAASLHIDPQRIAVSGFSAGGNMAFGVPLRVHKELERRKKQREPGVGDGRVTCVVAWYPSTDFTRPRDARREENERMEHELPRKLEDLFDSSYLYALHSDDMSSPYLSPGVASIPLLRDGLPDDIIVYACEWDGLRAEAERFVERLKGPVGKKRVKYKVLEGMTHGFDKGANPFKWEPRAAGLYAEACAELRRVFEDAERT